MGVSDTTEKDWEEHYKAEYLLDYCEMGICDKGRMDAIEEYKHNLKETLMNAMNNLEEQMKEQKMIMTESEMDEQIALMQEETQYQYADEEAEGMVRSRAEEECETLGEAYDEGYQQGREDAIDEVLDIAYHCVDLRDLCGALRLMQKEK